MHSFQKKKKKSLLFSVIVCLYFFLFGRMFLQLPTVFVHMLYNFVAYQKKKLKKKIKNKRKQKKTKKMENGDYCLQD